MVDHNLKTFDHELGEYVLDQIRAPLRTLAPLRKPVGPLRFVEWNRLSLSDWMAHEVALLAPTLGDHIWAGVDEESSVQRPLTDDELNALSSAVECPPLCLDRLCVWEASPAVHRRAVECVRTIRSELTVQTAEEWAMKSANYATRLSADPLHLSEGIAIVHEWLCDLRCLLHAMGEMGQPSCPGGATDRPHSTPVVPAWVRASLAGQANVASQNMPKKILVGSDSAVCEWKEAMAVTGLKKSKLYDLFHKGVIKGYRDGRMIRFYRAALNGYMRSRENAVASPIRPVRRARKGGTPAPGTVRFKFL